MFLWQLWQIWTDFNNPFTVEFCDELSKSFYIIQHLNSNLLPHYFVKFECSAVQPYTIVIQFKSVQSRLFSVNIYRDDMILITCLYQLIYNIVTGVQNKHHQHTCFESCTPTVSRCVARYWAKRLTDAIATRNLLRWCDVRWRIWHSEKTLMLS